MRCRSCGHDHVVDATEYKKQRSKETGEGVAEMAPSFVGSLMGLAEAFAPGTSDKVFKEFTEEIKHKTDVFTESQKTRRREEMEKAKGGMKDVTPPDDEDPDVSDWFDRKGL
jgi:hypothetical protein